MAATLKLLEVMKPIKRPNKKVVNNRLRKSFASPFEAQANPTIEQAKIRVR